MIELVSVSRKKMARGPILGPFPKYSETTLVERAKQACFDLNLKLMLFGRRNGCCWPTGLPLAQSI